MITPWTIYFISVLDSISIAFGIVGFVLAIFTLILFITSSITLADHYNSDEAYEVAEDHKNLCKKLIAICSICLACDAFIPTSKTVAAMIIIPAIANNENIQSISNNTLDSLKLLTDEWVKELSPNKDK